MPKKSDAEDLIGDTSKKKGKSAAKDSKKGKPDKKEKAKAKGDRNARGEGKFFFPADDPERGKIRKLIEKQITKSEISTKDFAGKHDLPTWKVRLVAKAMVKDKALKLEKSGPEGGVLTMKPPKGK